MRSILKGLKGPKKRKLSKETLGRLRHCTSFNDKELKAWHREFHSGCSSGVMSQKDFEDIYKSVYNEKDVKEYASHIFRTFDTNGDQTIDFTEFMIGLSITGRGTKEDKLRWTFNMCDVDKSGSVSQEQLADIIRSIMNIMGRSVDEAEGPEKTAEVLFRMIDIDNDGSITVDEFVDAAKQNELLLKLLEYN